MRFVCFIFRPFVSISGSRVSHPNDSFLPETSAVGWRELHSPSVHLCRLISLLHMISFLFLILFIIEVHRNANIVLIKHRAMALF